MKATAAQIRRLAAGKPVKPKPPLERDVQREVVAYLESQGVLVVRVNSGAMTGEANGKRRFVRFNSQPGCSDLLCVMPDGRFAAFEVKRPGWNSSMLNTHELEQAAFLTAVRRRGGIGAFVMSVRDVELAVEAERRDDTGGLVMNLYGFEPVEVALRKIVEEAVADMPAGSMITSPDGVQYHPLYQSLGEIIEVIPKDALVRSIEGPDYERTESGEIGTVRITLTFEVLPTADSPSIIDETDGGTTKN